MDDTSLNDIVAHFKNGKWIPAAAIKRPFVKHLNPRHSTGKVWKYTPKNTRVKISVVIPTLDANRDGIFIKLLNQINQQTFKSFETIIIKGDLRQGRAINIGAAISQADYLVTLDDDTSLPDPEAFNHLAAVLDSYPEIGIAGGNNIIPQDANTFVKRVMKEIPRRSWEPVQSITDSDLAEHPCMMMRTLEFKRIGGENELMQRGLDPYLREEYRKIGKRVVVVPKVIYHHLPPANLKKLLRQFFRNGRQAAYTNRNYPQWVIETPKAHGPFKSHATMLKRTLRFPMRLMKALITGKPIWFLCDFCYALGFACNFLLKDQ
jgi:GT2 family glycosyltransferase